MRHRTHLRTEREEWGTHFVGCVQVIERLGHPPCTMLEATAISQSHQQMRQCFHYFSSPLLLNIVQRPPSRCNSKATLTLAFSYWKSAVIDARQRLGFRHFCTVMPIGWTDLRVPNLACTSRCYWTKLA